MTAPYQRHRDPQPIGQGWEIAVAVIFGVLLGLGFAALFGLALASTLFGGGWVWPRGNPMIGHTLGGLFAGHPGRGLPDVQAQRVPGRVAVYSCVVMCELGLVVVSAWVGVLIVRYRSPRDARGGMATRREAQQVLGLGQLHAVKAIIRPDLHATEATKDGPR